MINKKKEEVDQEVYHQGVKEEVNHRRLGKEAQDVEVYPHVKGEALHPEEEVLLEEEEVQGALIGVEDLDLGVRERREDLHDDPEVQARGEEEIHLVDQLPLKKIHIIP